MENIGYQMLMKMGWKEGEGLGSEGQGIKAPVNKYATPFSVWFFTAVLHVYMQAHSLSCRSLQLAPALVYL